jgi:hypothetical protein
MARSLPNVIRELQNDNHSLRIQLQQARQERDIVTEREELKIKMIHFFTKWTKDETKLLESIDEINDNKDLKIEERWDLLEKTIQNRIIELNLSNSLLKESIDSLNEHMKMNFKIRQTKEAINKIIQKDNETNESLLKWQDTIQEINGQFEEELGGVLPNYGETDLEIIQENWNNIKKLINTLQNRPRPEINPDCEYRINQWKNTAIYLEQLRQQTSENCTCDYQG